MPMTQDQIENWLARSGDPRITPRILPSLLSTRLIVRGESGDTFGFAPAEVYPWLRAASQAQRRGGASSQAGSMNDLD